MGLRRLSQCLKSILVVLLVVSAAGCAGQFGKGNNRGPVSLTILFFNDLHGHLTPFEIKGEDGGQEEVGGIARMAYLVREIREENSRRDIRTVLLMAGDMLQGTPMSTVFMGEPDIKCLNIMGLDAAAVGNHEFDFGLDNYHAKPPARPGRIEKAML